MKRKLTITIDEELIPKAREVARSEGVSLSQLVETSLRDAIVEEDLLVERWRGKFELADRNDERYRALVKKYL